MAYNPWLSGIVYVLQTEGSQPVKIGQTAETVEDRIKELQPGNPYPLRELASFHSYSYRQIEQALHRRYKPYRMNNEWFNLPPDILAKLLEHCASMGKAWEVWRTTGKI